MWDHKMIEASFGINESAAKSEHYLKEYFVDRQYKPKTEEEKKTIEEFCMITSAMAIMIHIAEIDKEMDQKEHDEIIDQMIFQLHQRYQDYKNLSEKYGKQEKDIIMAVFDNMMKQYHAGGLHIDETINAINIVFMNNPYAKNFILRLCFFTAFADNCFKMAEVNAIKDIACKLSIPEDEQSRIEKEVIAELKLDKKEMCEPVKEEE